MDEQATDRLCGLVARLRQQHAALSATLGEIEACLAGPPPEPAQPARAAAANPTRAGLDQQGAPPVRQLA